MSLSISQKLSFVYEEPYFHSTAIAAVSQVLGEAFGKGLAEKIKFGMVGAVVLPLFYFGCDKLIKKNNEEGYNPLLSCLISSASLVAGIALNPFLKPAPEGMRIIVSLLVTGTVSLNLSGAILSYSNPPPEENYKNNPQYKSIESESDSLRS